MGVVNILKKTTVIATVLLLIYLMTWFGDNPFAGRTHTPAARDFFHWMEAYIPAIFLGYGALVLTTLIAIIAGPIPPPDNRISYREKKEETDLMNMDVRDL